MNFPDSVLVGKVALNRYVAGIDEEMLAVLGSHTLKKWY